MSTQAYHTSSPVSTYKRYNRQISEGHDFGTASYWYRIDGGELREFSSRTEMEKGLDRELTPLNQVPDLPQLPVRVPSTSTANRTSRARVVACHGHSIPSQGIIFLPAQLGLEARPISFGELSSGLQATIKTFLDDSSDYFNLLSEIDNRKMSPRDWHDVKWHLICAFERMSGKAFTYALMTAQEVL